MKQFARSNISPPETQDIFCFEKSQAKFHGWHADDLSGEVAQYLTMQNKPYPSLSPTGERNMKQTKFTKKTQEAILTNYSKHMIRTKFYKLSATSNIKH